MEEFSKQQEISHPGMIPAKGLYMSKDLQRFAKKYEVKFNHNPYFPINTLSLMRGAISYQIQGDLINI